MANNSTFQWVFRRIVREISARQDLPVETVKERLGEALNRKVKDPRSPIAHFFKGNIPKKAEDVKTLATVLKNQFGVSRADVRQFLESARYSDSKALCDWLY